MTRDRVLMCCGPILACLLDLGLTLMGQPETYWSGRYDIPRESNPLPHWLLQQHPLVLPIVMVSWIAVFSTTIWRLSRPAAQIVAFAVLLGHSVAALSWLITRPYGLLWCLLLLLSARYLDTLIWDKARDGPQHHKEDGSDVDVSV